MGDEIVNITRRALIFLVLIFHSSNSSFVKIGRFLFPREITCPDPYINFNLYTSQNRKDAQEVNSSTDAILKSNFEPKNINKIIIHGYDSNKDEEVQEIKEAYLTKGNYNVWMVDWRFVAAGPLFPLVVASLNHVGVCVAEFIQNLRNVTSTTSLEFFHIIGFSLGAHVAAIAAKHLKPYKLPRITGLDPANFIPLKSLEKLNIEAAEFVDVLHTSALVSGLPERCGHIDFYINGGFIQPGCWTGDVAAFLRCNHLRVIAYFAESIVTDVGFWGWSCRSFLDYVQNKCPPQTPTVLMGEYCDRKSTDYYIVSTAAERPFAMGTKLVYGEAVPQKTSR